MKNSFKQLLEVLMAGFVGFLIIAGLLYFYQLYLASMGIAFLSGACLAVAGSIYYFAERESRNTIRLIEVQKEKNNLSKKVEKLFKHKKKENRRPIKV